MKHKLEQFPTLYRLVATIWLVLVVAGWLVLHRNLPDLIPALPFVPQIWPALANTLAAIGLLILSLLASALIGWRLLGWLVCRLELAKLEQVLFGLGLGLGLNGFLMLGFGLLGFVGWPLAGGLLLGELVLGGPQIWLWLKTFSSLKPERYLGQTWTKANWVSRLLWLYLLLVALSTLAVALAPPLGWDGLLYHLTGPKLYIEAGRIGPQRDLVFTNYPFGVEMLYTWAMLLQGDGLAQAIHWSFGIAGGLAIYAFGRRFFEASPGTPLLAATLYLSIPLVQTLMGWAYTDLAVTFYNFLAFYAVMLAFKIPAASLPRLMLLAGLCTGLAFGGKYTSLIGVPAVVAVFGWVGWRAGLKWRKLAGGLLWFGLAALAMALPWLGRNLAFSDNPIAPLLFGARGWDKAELAHYVGDSGQPTFSLLDLLALPWSLSVKGTTGGDYDATFSPLFLALAPLIALVVWRERRTRVAGREVALAFGVHYLTWLAIVAFSPLSAQGRMLLPAFPLLALLAGHALAELPRLKLGLLRPAANLVLALYLLFNALNLVVATFDPVPVLLGLRSQEIYLEYSLGGSYYRAARFISQNLPPDAYVHTFFEPRSYYFDRRTAPDNDLGQFFYYFERYPDPAAFVKVLQSRGATHLLISEKGRHFLESTPEYGQVETLKRAKPLFDSLENRPWQLLYREVGEYAVYKLN